MHHETMTVLGAGYVGLTTATLLAHAGYTVYLIEPNPSRLEIIKSGKSFFFEAGLDPLISSAIASGKLIPTDSYKDSIPSSTVVFSCVGTPDNPDGSSNLTYVFAAAEQSAEYMNEGTVYVQKSTVPVGTGLKVQEKFKAAGKKVDYISNPEFLREGTALADTLYFDRVVAGGENKAAVEHVLDIYRHLEHHRNEIAPLANIEIIDRKGQYIATSLNSAELIKVTANAFLALKISFANSIAMLADKVDADVVEVMDAVGADERIGRAFLNAGRGYGGGCFPKDVSGLISSGLENGVDLEIMQAAQQVNSMMPGYIIEKLRDQLGGDLTGKKIAILGLSFKAGTSDTRKSPGISIANSLANEGSIVTAFDPVANEEASHDIEQAITITDSIEQAIESSEAIVIATEWAEFINLTPNEYKSNSKATVIVDAINRLERNNFESFGFTYIGVGR